MKNKVLLIIPCYNVEKTIKKALGNISKKNLGEVSEILIINNRSTDNTLKLIQKIKLNIKKNLSIINNNDNYGLGGSLKIGFMHAIENKFDFVIIVHSDEQGNTDKILGNFFTNINKNKEVDFYMASRFINESKITGYSKVRILGNYFFNFITFLLTTVKLSDSGCGIIAIKTKTLKRVNFLDLSDNFYFNPQLNVYLGRLNGILKKDIPIEWKDSEIPSNLKIISYIYGLLKFLFSVFFKGTSKKPMDAADIKSFKRKYIYKLIK